MSKAKEIKKELMLYREEYGIVEKIPCSKEDNEEYVELLKNGSALPDGVYQRESDFECESAGFYTYSKADLTETEIAEYLWYCNSRNVKTIKNCVLFFTVVGILSLTCAAISVLSVILPAIFN